MRSVVLGVIAALLAFAPADARADDRKDQGTHLTKEEVQATLKALPPGSGTEQMLRMVDVGRANVGIAIMRREAKKQGAIEHDNLTEVYYILEGSGTLVTGRTLVEPKRIDPDGNLVKTLTGPSVSGPSIENGHSQKFGPGDSIIIPAGVGHWFSSLDSAVNYLVVRIDLDKMLPQK